MSSRLSGRSGRLRPAIVLLLLLLTIPAKVVAQTDCTSDERYRALDFLLGQWQVETAEGEVLGQSHIEKRHQGCVLAEAWTGADGSSAETLTYLDPSTGLWHQLGLSSGGSILRLEGSFPEGTGNRAGRLDLTGELIQTGGTSHIRGDLEQKGDGVLESLESSTDGRNFTPLLTVRYRPLDRVTQTRRAPAEGAQSTKTPARETPSEGSSKPVSPAAEARPTTVDLAARDQPPAAEPAPASRVRNLSVRDAEPVSVIDVESPMILQIELGPIEKTTEGYGWTSDETSLYRCDGATVTMVQVSRTSRRGKVRIESSVFVRGEARSERYELEVALLDGERVIGSETTRFQAGRGIPSQLQHGAVEREFTWELSQDEFDRLFQEGRPRPTLQLTLSSQ